jgi:hypothetical protein
MLHGTFDVWKLSARFFNNLPAGSAVRGGTFVAHGLIDKPVGNCCLGANGRIGRIVMNTQDTDPDPRDRDDVPETPPDEPKPPPVQDPPVEPVEPPYVVSGRSPSALPRGKEPSTKLRRDGT